MAPIPIKYVVSFSSQDPKYPIQNLLNSTSSGVNKSWLVAPGEKNGHLEAVLQLERACKISHIDIGTFWTFSVQIKVGRSSWPQDRDYLTLLPASNFMKPDDVKLGKNKTNIRMFKEDNFDAKVKEEAWDRVKIICSQPLKKNIQFGLSFIKFISMEIDEKENQDVIQNQQNSELRESERGSSLNTPKRNGTKMSMKSSPNGNTLPTSSQIHKHFFGNKTQRNEREDELKSRLTKMEGSTEDWADCSSYVSRQAKLVMAAVDKTPKYKEPDNNHKVKLLPKSSEKDHTKRKKIPIEVQMKDFLARIDTKTLNLDTVTYADLRHRFEKQIFRKLSKEEKKHFFEQASEFVENLIAKEEERRKQRSKKSEDIGKIKNANLMKKNVEDTISNKTPSKDVNKIVVIQSPLASNSSPKRKIIQDDVPWMSKSQKKEKDVTLKPSYAITLPVNPRVRTPSRGRGRASNVERTETLKQIGEIDWIPSSDKTPPTRGRPQIARRGRGNATKSDRIETPKQSEDIGWTPSSETILPIVSPRGRAQTPRRGRGRGKATKSTNLTPSADDTLPTISASGRTQKARRGRRINETVNRTDVKDNSSTCGSIQQDFENNFGVQSKVRCPLCDGLFPQQDIENHAATCQIMVSSDSDEDLPATPQSTWSQHVIGNFNLAMSPSLIGSESSDDNTTSPYVNKHLNSSQNKKQGLMDLGSNVISSECPICGNYFPATVIQQHADRCIDLTMV